MAIKKKKKTLTGSVFNSLNRPLYSGPRSGCSCVAPLSWASLCRNNVCPTPRPMSSSSSTRRTSRASQHLTNTGKTQRGPEGLTFNPTKTCRPPLPATGHRCLCKERSLLLSEGISTNGCFCFYFPVASGSETTAVK